MNASLLRLGALVSWLAVASAVAAEPGAPESFRPLGEQPVDVTQGRNLYVIGYSHLDTQWRWSYPQVIREYVADTLRHNFTLLDRYPNYRFNFSGSRRYEMMAEYYPAEFLKLKTYIAAGRWFPAGSSVDEADSIVPSGESLLRHILYGNHYFRREFGLASDEFMLPDCFGFPAGLPSILAHAGIKGFSTQKLTWGSPIGIPFKVGVWEGPDGRGVVAALDPGAYSASVTEDLSRSESWLRRIENTGSVSKAYVDYHYYGTGDRGGSPTEGSVQWIERSLVGGGPVHVISARADQMFKDLRPEQTAALPRYQGELLLTQHSAGSITSEAYMKRWNRKNELLADAAERASVAASWLRAAPYPTRKLYDGWDLLLGSQMHDMLPGTSLPKAYEFCWNDEVLAANQFAAALQQGVGGVAAALDTRGQGVPLVVFNPLSIAREDVVEATVEFPGAIPAHLAVLAPDGQLRPGQVLARDGRRATVAFTAAMPPVGFATFDVRAATAEAGAGTLRVSGHQLENSAYRVTLDEAGDVASIFDQRQGRELLAGPLRLAFLSEKPEQYPAWNMDWADRRKPPRSYVGGPARIRIVEAGPVRVALEVTREAEGSRFTQIIRLAGGAAAERVEFVNHIDWQTAASSLKAVFPFAAGNPVATYDSQLGTVERGNNSPARYEVPQHQWFDLTAVDGHGGVAVLNDGKFGSDKPDDHTLRLTLLYTPGVRSRYQDQATQDFGRHDTEFAVVSHRGDWREGAVPWQGARLNQPLLAFQVAPHEGRLGRQVSLFSVNAGGVMVQAIKQAEDSDEIVVRVRELFGRAAAHVTLQAAAPISAARELDGQERPLGAAGLSEGKLDFDLGAYGLRTFGVTLAAPTVVVGSGMSQPVALEFNEDVASGNANRADGDFDADGRSYPAEQFPRELVSEGVQFRFGSTAEGQLNAVAARGQTIALPAGDFDRVYLVAAATDEAKATFAVDGSPVELEVQKWTGYIGQWDCRQWEGNVPEVAFSWFNRWNGLSPGYTKPANVAWFCSHRHSPAGDDPYEYSYLFKYRLVVPPGARTLQLPNDPRIRVFAVTAARLTHDDAVAATALFDRLDDHVRDAPRLPVADNPAADALTVAIEHPLYWREGALRFTVDGSTPTAASPTYREPFVLHRDTTVKAAELDEDGRPGMVAEARYRVKDVTPPRVLSAVAVSTAAAVRVTFSEPLERATAENVANYRLGGGNAVVTSARLSPDEKAVTLMLERPLIGSAVLNVSGLKDLAPQANVVSGRSASVPVASTIVYGDVVANAPADRAVAGLPVRKTQPWTMNVFVRTTAPVANRTLIAGFGATTTRRDGTGRYFAVMGNGIHLWTRGAVDLESDAKLRPNTWQMLTATYDGETLGLYVDGERVGAVELGLADDEAAIHLRPLDPWDNERRFAGELRGFAVWDRVLPPAAIDLLRTIGEPGAEADTRK